MKEPIIGRATIENIHEGVRITVRQVIQKDVWSILQVIFIVVLWLLISLIPIAFLIGTFLSNLSIVQLICACAVILFFLRLTFLFVQSILFVFLGKEVVTITSGQMLLEKYGLLFCRPVKLDLSKVKNLHVRYDNGYEGSGKPKRPIYLVGTIHFQYLDKKLRFGSSLNEQDANSFISISVNKGLLTEGNFIS